jgi:hypothetical protein
MNPTSHTVTTGRIVAKNGEAYPDDVYEESSRATGTQQEIANMWADGKLPVHSTAGSDVKLYVSGGNFVGLQKTDRSGKLVHYDHIEAIRTKSGLIISDSSCYAKGRALCSTPRNSDIECSFDVTTLKANLRGEPETIYEITDVDDEEVTFESDRKMDLDGYNWVEDSQTKEVSVLGI